jgi:hypothetical protein
MEKPCGASDQITDDLQGKALAGLKIAAGLGSWSFETLERGPWLWVGGVPEAAVIGFCDRDRHR